MNLQRGVRAPVLDASGSDYPDRTGLGHARRRLDEIAATDDPRRRLRALLHEGMPGVPIDVGV